MISIGSVANNMFYYNRSYLPRGRYQLIEISKDVLSLQSFSGRVVVPDSHFSRWTRSDTGASFASLDALITYLRTIIF